MPSPNEKLAESLDALKELQQGNRHVFRSDDLSRVHRERLVENGFLQEVMKGWLISSSPDAQAGESTPWHASFWEFCARYCDERFGEQWHLSPEQSLFLHGERTVIPDQLVVHSPKATNNDIKLLFGHNALRSESCGDAGDRGSHGAGRTASVFTGGGVGTSAGIVFSVVSTRDASGDGEPRRRLGPASASPERRSFRESWLSCQSLPPNGRGELADEIVRAMKGAGYDVRESSPFEAGQILRKPSRPSAPMVSRVEMLWD